MHLDFTSPAILLEAITGAMKSPGRAAADPQLQLVCWPAIVLPAYYSPQEGAEGGFKKKKATQKWPRGNADQLFWDLQPVMPPCVVSL